MLTDEEKVHLRSEEEYRREVQAEFARTRQRTAWQQFLDFFESSFGKWVLTSLLATGVTLLVTAAHETFNRERIKREAAEARSRLDAELVAKVLPMLKDYCEPTGLTAFAVLTELGQKGINPALASGIARSTERFLLRSTTHDDKPVSATCISDIVAIVGRKDLDVRQALSDALAKSTPTPSDTGQLTLVVPPGASAEMSLFSLGYVVPGNQATQSAGSLKGVAPRVYVQIQKDSGQESFSDTLITKLREEKFILPGIEKLPATKMPGKPQVRYFSDEDRDNALQVVAAAKQAIPSLSFEAVRVTNLPAPSGTLEVWFGRRG